MPIDIDKGEALARETSSLDTRDAWEYIYYHSPAYMLRLYAELRELRDYKAECQRNCMGGRCEDIKTWVAKERLDAVEAELRLLRELEACVDVGEEYRLRRELHHLRAEEGRDEHRRPHPGD